MSSREQGGWLIKISLGPSKSMLMELFKVFPVAELVFHADQLVTLTRS